MQLLFDFPAESRSIIVAWSLTTGLQTNISDAHFD